MKIRLAHQKVGGNTSIFSIQKFPATFGRDAQNDVTVNDNSVSRRHAEIFLKKDKPFIQDLDSANGTQLNGKKIKSSILSDGDLLQLGSFPMRVNMGEAVVEEAKEEWDLSTHLISPEELGATVKGGVSGDLGASTSSILGFFQRAGKVLESAFELEDIVSGLLDLTFEIIPATRGFVLLADPESGEMVVRAQKFRGHESKQVKGGLDLSTTILDHAIKHGKAVLTLDAGRDERFGKAESVKDQEIRGAICVPLKGRTEILGAIYVHSGIASDKFTINDLKLMTAVGAEMGVAVENVMLYKENIKREKLAAVGQAVAGLGHCIKNILNGMEGGSFILEKGLEKGKDDSVHEGWDILKRNSSRLKDLMLDMLAYSKPREPVYTEIDGNSIQNEVVELLQERAKAKGVDLQCIHNEEIGRVVLDGKAIYRGILNLVTNALDACPEENGTVEVKTLLVQGGDRFQIVVQDNGCGISEENLSKMGKAFFSTKGGGGTGLGLSVTYKVIAEHKGNVEVSSTLGEGTAFTVTLPVSGPLS
ncbi:ATP-binding protein [Acidobacteriota bacterium]